MNQQQTILLENSVQSIFDSKVAGPDHVLSREELNAAVDAAKPKISDLFPEHEIDLVPVSDSEAEFAGCKVIVDGRVLGIYENKMSDVGIDVETDDIEGTAV